MKLIANIVLCFCLSTSFAFAGNGELLKNIVDEYNYSLSVEWDQKDQKFYDLKTKEFFTQLDSLIAEKGLQKADLMEFLEKSIKDKFILESMKTRFALTSGSEINSQEIMNVLKESTGSLYTRGASWIDGEVLLYIGGGLVLAAIIAYAVWFEINYDCVRRDYVKHCGYVSNTSNGPKHYDCWYKYECVQYERKK